MLIVLCESVIFVTNQIQHEVVWYSPFTLGEKYNNSHIILEILYEMNLTVFVKCCVTNCVTFSVLFRCLIAMKYGFEKGYSGDICYILLKGCIVGRCYHNVTLFSLISPDHNYDKIIIDECIKKHLIDFLVITLCMTATYTCCGRSSYIWNVVIKIHIKGIWTRFCLHF